MAYKTSPLRETIKHSVIWFVLLFAFFPLYLTVVIALKNNDQFNNNPWFFDPISQWQWGNWGYAWGQVRGAIANSVVVAVGAVIGSLTFALLASYALARYRFVGREVIYYGLLGTMFLPGSAASLVTTFMMLRGMNLTNSHWALIIMGIAGGQVVSVFILRQFIEEIPKELFESAQIDGAGHLRQIFHIVLPMSGSVLSTLAIMQLSARGTT
jgi:ABC-type glycerol-3-phosphate transport system permease component